MAKARIAVVGAGLMGHGIAQVFALAGHDVTLTDAHAPTLATAKDRILANLTDLGDDAAALDTRAHHARTSPTACAMPTTSSKPCAKTSPSSRSLFADIERAARPDAILASNTSVIPITAIMQRLAHRERALGTHWWNPPYLVPLVEVIGTEWTSPAAIDFTMKLHQDIGKTPVHVKKDVPGFVGNRLQHALWREAISLVENGICDAETVDTVIKAAFGRRLAVLGPLENADLVGTDLTLAIHRTVLPAIDSRPGPVALSGKAGRRRQARHEIRRRLPHLDAGAAGRAACARDAAISRRRVRPDVARMSEATSGATRRGIAVPAFPLRSCGLRASRRQNHPLLFRLERPPPPQQLSATATSCLV